MKGISLFVGFGLMLLSCTSGKGNVVKGGELSVYFIETEDEELATQIANFWKDNELLTGKPQDLQLLRIEDGYQLLIIESEVGSEINFIERKLLSELQDSLMNTLDLKNLELAIANSKFEIVHTLNQ